MIDITDIEPDKFYWVRSHKTETLEIIHVSTVFGAAREYWTSAVLGSDTYATLDEFDFVSKALQPAGIAK